ncbi:bifunctional metallophosphatase/5'-nucleotidase [Streptococcus loxodontisalivarius]|uniref:2',3'-cyclic-nucleotide 2'-phosphodiesterase (5'-nucleotidase family) n=1 Tax=Streptococcus loxodontisalivarius TaxID=1349415 RepID=A0ABS2PRC7_9STRE|nr:metallophosphatase [Streptococcus loxodontisalivarius]MBM7642582.1 2',3'-cyclic-nucleotide 2'-phosphodiesterase (5'-nucleotidase family) [Streptococcus loxodontisalivarius]
MIEQIRLLHLNDLHSHFEHYPKVKRFFERACPDEIETIRLDIGDNVDKSHPLTAATSGRANVHLMNRLQLDFATIGNNEGIGLSKAEMNKLYDEADFQVLLGNLEDGTGQPAWASPYAIYKTKAGTKIAFLAYTFPYYLTYQPNGWQVLDPLTCLERDLTREEVAEADLIVLLSHLGLPYDEKIAERFDQIDLIIGSHTHHLLEEGAVVNGTYLAAAGRYGEYVGQIDLNLKDGQIDQIEILAHKTSHLPSLPEDEIWIEEQVKRGFDLLSEDKICQFDHDLTLEASADLTMKAMKSYAQAPFCIINSGLIVEPFTKDLTMAELQRSLPHQMRLVRLEVTLDELAEICQEVFGKEELLRSQQIKGMGFRGKIFGNVLTSGFTYKNGKIVYNDKVIRKSDRYSLVLVDQYYFASYFETIKSKKAELLFPELLRELVADDLRQ